VENAINKGEVQSTLEVFIKIFGEGKKTVCEKSFIRSGPGRSRRTTTSTIWESGERPQLGGVRRLFLPLAQRRGRPARIHPPSSSKTLSAGSGCSAARDLIAVRFHAQILASLG